MSLLCFAFFEAALATEGELAFVASGDEGGIADIQAL